MDRVFGTVELLEVILLNLNCIELLRAKRISKHFCAVIDTSPAMRKSLWLDPPNVADEEILMHPMFQHLDLSYAKLLRDHKHWCECHDSSPACANLDLRPHEMDKEWPSESSIPATWQSMPAFRCRASFELHITNIVQWPEDDPEWMLSLEDTKKSTKFLTGDRVTVADILRNMISFAKNAQIPGEFANPTYSTTIEVRQYSTKVLAARSKEGEEDDSGSLV